MIVTLTPNPAVDQTVRVRALDLGDVNRVFDTQLDPAGKGINASRVVHRLGWPTLAFGFLAGEAGSIVERSLDEEGVQHHFVRVPGQTRINFTIVEEQRATSFYGPGPSVSQEHLRALERIVSFWMQACRVLVLAGSLPPGVPESAYKDFVGEGRRLGVKVILDADGEALVQGFACKPDLVKPNLREAERLLGRSLPDLDAVVAGAQELARRSQAAAVISLGARGAVCADGRSVWLARPPKVDRLSTVGSGDSMVAGLAVAMARGEPLEQGLRLGSAAGAATAGSFGTALGRFEDIEAMLPRVHLEQLL